MKNKKVDKTDLIREIITEIGVDINKENLIVDQECGNPIMYEGKKLKFVGDEQIKVNKTETVFDPVSDRKLMASILAYNNTKAVEDGSSSPISVFYNLDADEQGKGSVELKDTDNNIFTSRPYYNDSLKIADVMFKMNGTDKDLSEYDAKIIPNAQQKKKPTKK